MSTKRPLFEKQKTRPHRFCIVFGINIFRILMILVPFESALKALSIGTKIIKIRKIFIQKMT